MPDPQSHPLPFIILIIAIAAIGCVVSSLYGDSFNEIDLEKKHIFSFIAFAVALASYLAATIRELVKSTKNSTKKAKLRWNIFFVTAGEASLLFFGVIAILKLYKDSWVSYSFIISYLAVILIYLIILHVRAWFTFNSPPWKISE